MHSAALRISTSNTYLINGEKFPQKIIILKSFILCDRTLVWTRANSLPHFNFYPFYSFSFGIFIVASAKAMWKLKTHQCLCMLNGNNASSNANKAKRDQSLECGIALLRTQIHSLCNAGRTEKLYQLSIFSYNLTVTSDGKSNAHKIGLKKIENAEIFSQQRLKWVDKVYVCSCVGYISNC